MAKFRAKKREAKRATVEVYTSSYTDCFCYFFCLSIESENKNKNNERRKPPYLVQEPFFIFPSVGLNFSRPKTKFSLEGNYFNSFSRKLFLKQKTFFVSTKFFFLKLLRAVFGVKSEATKKGKNYSQKQFKSSEKFLININIIN